MDDEESMREIVAQTLVQLGYTVELAREGNEAVALYDQANASGRPFAAVLLDLTVKGGMGGVETIKVLRERDPLVRAVLMTGYDNEKTFRDHIQLGFRATLPKPFPVEKLRDVLAGVLASPSDEAGL
jgi:DNA-binding NtrC family response regulator